MPNHLWCKGEGPRQCHKFTYRFAGGKLMHFCGVSSPHFSVPKMEQVGPRPSRFCYSDLSTSQNRRYHFLADSISPWRTFLDPGRERQRVMGWILLWWGLLDSYLDREKVRRRIDGDKRVLLCILHCHKRCANLTPCSLFMSCLSTPALAGAGVNLVW